ncbi:hypothetical protein GCM10011519_35230 [Marmoricola endophyticus]|uniref:Lon N-terminal domain-containing protein n=1 Tax=Marmoricola endophyticus TaxID=2040280 RepID=A0A917BVG1_9ACTN|nr:LON peptidase substrate-binding domain-containing protein [Marmoricola endophyticus]GGF58346.1 hypothetical protein GCM10011519_35230 [Marmoricola endophyticus]
MTTRLPLFPLNTVAFPGVAVPLYVFEDRYRALVRDLLAEPDPTQRVFGITSIREGYEVTAPGDGEGHGAQSLHTVGTVMQLTEHERDEEGTFQIESVGRQRFRLHRIDGSGEYAVGEVDLVEDPPGEDLTPSAIEQAGRTLRTFEAYREQLGQLRGGVVLSGTFPTSPTFLSWSLSATCLLTGAEKQRLLETTDAESRLLLLRHLLAEEMRAMRAVPSLPATEVSRLRWSPN